MQKIIFALAGVFLIALAAYGFVTTGNIGLNNFTGLHNVYHLVAGLVVLWFAFANRSITRVSQMLGLFFVAVTFDSYISHHAVEWHTSVHFVLAALFLILGFTRALASTNERMMASA